MKNTLIQEISRSPRFQCHFAVEEMNRLINDPQFIDTINTGLDTLNDTTVNDFWSASPADDKIKRIICDIYDTRKKNVLITQQKQQYGHLVPRLSKTFDIGAILWSSWGYEQTNNSYFVIVEVNKSFVKLLPLSNNYKPGTGFYDMQGMSTAGKEIDFSTPPIKRKVKEHGVKYVKIESYMFAYIWDGEEKQESHYA